MSPLQVAEAAYLAAREAHDRREVGLALGTGTPADGPAFEEAARTARGRLDAVDARDLDEADRRALATMRQLLAEVTRGDHDLGVVEPADDDSPDGDEGGGAGVASADAEPAGDYEVLHDELQRAYAGSADRLVVDDRPDTRREILGEIALEPDDGRRRRLFLALEPLWRAVHGDGGASSPYWRFVHASAEVWQSGRSPIEANATGLGVDAATIEAWCEAILEGWRLAAVEPARRDGQPDIEPWDWWWRQGEAERRLDRHLPLDRIQPLVDQWAAALGADVDRLAITWDVRPRAGRPAIPVAFTTFGGRPWRDAAGRHGASRPFVFATYLAGGFGALNELVHELGHAIHIAAIDTRPAYADWPDSDALTEAIAEVNAIDTIEPAWLGRWIEPAAGDIPLDVVLRWQYATVALDTALALFEIRAHRDPDRDPSAIWTEITSRWLGVAPHPEWPWWAMRGQLVQSPGYMANYAIGAVLAAELRAAIRAARGDWLAGDPGWYGWVSERLFRYGRERSSGDVIRELLGRPPGPASLLREIGRIDGTT